VGCSVEYTTKVACGLRPSGRRWTVVRDRLVSFLDVLDARLSKFSSWVHPHQLLTLVVLPETSVGSVDEAADFLTAQLEEVMQTVHGRKLILLVVAMLFSMVDPKNQLHRHLRARKLKL